MFPTPGALGDAAAITFQCKTLTEFKHNLDLAKSLAIDSVSRENSTEQQCDDFETDIKKLRLSILDVSSIVDKMKHELNEGTVAFVWMLSCIF